MGDCHMSDCQMATSKDYPSCFFSRALWVLL